MSGRWTVWSTRLAEVRDRTDRCALVDQVSDDGGGEVRDVTDEPLRALNLAHVRHLVHVALQRRDASVGHVSEDLQ